MFSKKSLKDILMKLNRMTLPSSSSNVSYNRKAWDRYARLWNKNWIYFENQSADETASAEHGQLGTEWGALKDVERVIADYILPQVSSDGVVGEIGSGGGRVAARVAGKAGRFYCFDVSAQMLKRAQESLKKHSHVTYVHVPDSRLPQELSGKFDFIYAFDVFVHLDLHTLWVYFQEMSRVLKPGGKAFVHTANLKSPGGWERFASQEAYSIEGHYFISPETVKILAEHSGFEVVKEAPHDPSNFYLNRDYIAILRKKA